MSFLNPWFLVGLLAGAVPVMLHLMKRERARKVEFPALMFLRRISRKTVRFQRLRHLLLLLLRLLALVLLVAAFLRPYRPEPPGAQAAPRPGEAHIVLLDNSLSMAYGDRWERAKSEASAILRAVGAADRAAVVEFSDRAVVRVPLTADRTVALREVESGVEVSDRATNYEQALRAAERALDLGKTNPDAHRLRAHVFWLLENQPEKAAAQLQTAAAYQPQLWLRRHELGQMLLDAGYPSVAELAFEDALALRPKAVSYAGLGKASYELQQYDRAQEALTQAIDAGLNDAKVYGYLAAAYAQLGRCDEAESTVQQALALDPGQEEALGAGEVCRGTAKATETPEPAATVPSAPAEPTATRAVTALGGRIAFPSLGGKGTRIPTVRLSGRR